MSLAKDILEVRLWLLPQLIEARDYHYAQYLRADKAVRETEQRLNLPAGRPESNEQQPATTTVTKDQST